MKLWKKIAAYVLAAAMLVGTPLAADAKNNNGVDGNTPDDLVNRVVTTAGALVTPSVITDFHATDLTGAGMVPISPKHMFDMETKANISHYADAATHVYVTNNREYGQIAKTALDYARNAVGAKLGPTFTLNLFLFEGGVYKPQQSTVQEMEFIMNIPKVYRETARDYAVLRLNPDGTVSYLADLDSDPLTVTFKTNYFGTYSLYALAYGGYGCFDAYRGLPSLFSAQSTILAQQQQAALLAQQQQAALLVQQQQAALLVAQQQAALLVQQQQAALLAAQQQQAALLAQQQAALAW